ncbi:MAG: hypothetical protein GC161_04970 [Planctomycetaceae bacterium]|nr:hypothetical protein [Planctomycetaceae bacterium]
MHVRIQNAAAPKWRPLVGAALLFIAGACRTAPDSLPSGRGLLVPAAQEPRSEESFAAPAWKDGDTFEFVRGSTVRLRYRVEAAEDGGWNLVDVDKGTRLALDRDLGQLGERESDGDWRVRFDPVDPSFAWPLWSGKQWTGEFVRRADGDREVLLLASYRCGPVEWIDVPAGRVRAIQVWRTLSLAGAEGVPDFVSLLWYAPEFGTFARRLESGLLTELSAALRQEAGVPAPEAQ